MRSTSALGASLFVFFAACGGSGSPSAPATATSTLAIVLPSNTMVSGTRMQASATLDGVPTTAVTWKSSEPEMVSVGADGMLLAAFNGVAVVTATYGAMKATTLVKVTPGAPALIRIYSGDQQSANAGENARDPLCTIIMDAAGNLISGLVVTYTVATGGGTIAAPTAPATDSQGIAISGLWQLGTTPGKQTVTASYGNLTSVTFTATAK